MKPRGAGWIEQLPSGAYRAGLRISGRMRRKAYPTRAEAEQWLQLMRARKVAIDAGGEPTTGTRESITYREMVPEFIAWLKSGTRRVHTKAYLYTTETLGGKIVERWGDRPIRSLRSIDVDEWVEDMRGEGLATSTIRNRLNVVSGLHELAVRREYIPRLPCPIVRPQVVVRSKRDAVSREDVQKILGAAATIEDPRPLLVILLALDAGLRREEIARLQGDDVDLPGGFLHVAVRGETDRTKSGKGRYVPILTDDLRAALEEAGPSQGKSVVSGTSGTGRAVEALARRVTIAAGMGSTGILHRLRHTFATRLADGDVSPILIRDWLGHSTLAITDGYVHADKKRVPEWAISALARSTSVPRGTASGGKT